MARAYTVSTATDELPWLRDPVEAHRLWRSTLSWKRDASVSDADVPPSRSLERMLAHDAGAFRERARELARTLPDAPHRRALVLRAEDLFVIAEKFSEAGCDLIDVSSGQTVPDQKPIYGRMYQVPFAEAIRNVPKMATMAVGAITEPART